MKKVLIIILSLFIFTTCGPTKKITKPSAFYMRNLIERVYSYDQLDSLCIADGISTAPADWDKIYFLEADNTPVTEYSYIFTRNDTLFIYTAIPVKDDSIRVTKRIQVEK